MAKRAVVVEAQRAAWVELVLARMAEGKTVADTVQEEGLPVTAGAVRQWLREGSVRERYEQAKLALAQAMAEEAVRVARETTNHSSAADRLLIETLKWAAAKANPREYGDRQQVEHQGAQTLSVEIVEKEAVPAVNAAVSAPQAIRAIEQAVIAPVTMALPQAMAADYQAINDQ